MSDDRIDHKAEAFALVNVDPMRGYAAVAYAQAQVHATLYLAEQQRIANIIALSQYRVNPAGLPNFRHLVWDFDDDGERLSAEIREGLGLS